MSREENKIYVSDEEDKNLSRQNVVCVRGGEIEGQMEENVQNILLSEKCMSSHNVSETVLISNDPTRCFAQEINETQKTYLERDELGNEKVGDYTTTFELRLYKPEQANEMREITMVSNPETLCDQNSSELDDPIGGGSHRNTPTQSNQPYYYAGQQQGSYYGQTPYYQQQMVAGQPVYSRQQPPPPSNAARQAAYQPGTVQVVVVNAPESGQRRIFTNSFDSKIIRNRFVRRVYTILSVLLLITVAIIMMCMFEPHLKQYFLYNRTMLWVFMGLFLALEITLICYQAPRKTYPINFILLTLLAICMAFICGIISANLKTHIVFLAAGITTGVVVLVSIFACQTRIDVTGWIIYIYVAAMVLLLFGLIASLVAAFTGITILNTIYAGLAALLFTFLLIFDTQMIMGGRKLELSPEEYINGALQLYLDIMIIFICILSLLGGRSS